MLTMHTGDSISAANARWNFGNNIAKNFDRHVQRSIPFYHEGHGLIADLSDYFLSSGDTCYDLGCSTGSLLSLLRKRNVGRDVHFIGVDNQSEMIDMAKSRNAGAADVEFVCADICEMPLEKSNLVISYYTSHFICLDQRENLFSKVYDNLADGGAFILFEKTMSKSGHIQDMLSTLYADFKLAQGFSGDEILAKTRSLKGVLKPVTSKDNAKMLKRAGFSKTETIFRYLQFEGWLAVK